MRSSRFTRFAFPAASLLGVLLLAAGLALGHFRRGLFDAEAFSDRLARSLADPRVAAFVAGQITDEILRQSPDLTAFRPLVLGAAQGAASSRGFQAVVRTAARSAHAAAFSKGGHELLLTVEDADVLLRGVLANASPELAAKVPSRVRAVVGSLGEGKAATLLLDMAQRGRRYAYLARGLIVSGILLLLGSVLLAPDRRRGLQRAAVDVAGAGLLLALLLPVGRVLVSSLAQDPLGREAAAGFFDAFAGGLRTWALALAGVGLVFAAAARSLLDELSVPELSRRVWSVVENPPGGATGRAVRALALLGGGTLAVLHPRWTQDALALLIGAALVFLGLLDVFRLLERVVGPVAEDAEAVKARGAVGRAALVLALALLLALVALSLGRRPEPLPPPLTDTCNGNVALCDRRVDAVVFAGAHNAMSSADVANWMFPQQERGVAGMLADGVRALLMDVHNGRPVLGTGRVKTDLEVEKAFVEKARSSLGDEGVAAAMRIRDRLTGQEEGERGLYLCHGFCELGALPLTAWLRTLRDFLVSNPQEVVVLVFEDYVAPEEIAAAFAESGLDRLVYRGEAQPPWPTLRELSASSQRVLAFIESGRPGVAWLRPAFEAIQETPYHFRQPADFSCAPNRGDASSSLFQINHWIDTTPAPKPSNARVVNAYDFLLARARECQTERKMLPNVLAVDFYRTGDLMRVVRELNGLAGG